MTSLRFELEFYGRFYIQQNPDNKENRSVPWPPVNDKDKSVDELAPLYEIYIQKMVPKY
jgi:hypothetical protein